MMNRIPRRLRFLALLSWAVTTVTAFAAEAPRQTIVRAILAENDAEKRAIIGTLAGQGDESIKTLLLAWRSDALFVYTAPDGAKFPVQLTGEKDEKDAQAASRVDSGEPLKDAAGQPLRPLAAS
jgi:urea transport system permease protein